MRKTTRHRMKRNIQMLSEIKRKRRLTKHKQQLLKMVMLQTPHMQLLIPLLTQQLPQISLPLLLILPQKMENKHNKKLNRKMRKKMM